MNYLKEVIPEGKFTFQDLKFRNHNPGWVLRETEERALARQWLKELIKTD